MAIDMLNSRGAAVYVNGWQASLYQKVNNASQKTEWIRLSAPLVAVASSLLKAVQKVATIAETIFKGIGNILAFPFTDHCEFLAGVSQLFVKLPINIVALLLTPAEIALGAVITTGGVFFTPSSYSQFRARVHGDTVDAFKDAAIDTENLYYLNMHTNMIFA